MISDFFFLHSIIRSSKSNFNPYIEINKKSTKERARQKRVVFQEITENPFLVLLNRKRKNESAMNSNKDFTKCLQVA